MNVAQRPFFAAMNALTGYTVVNGVHVTVRASTGERLVAAARALRPIG